MELCRCEEGRIEAMDPVTINTPILKTSSTSKNNVNTILDDSECMTVNWDSEKWYKVLCEEEGKITGFLGINPPMLNKKM